MNRPATTATGTRDEADDTLPILSDAGWPTGAAPSRGPAEPLASRASVAGSGSASNRRSRTSANSGSSGAARMNSVMDERSLTASIPPKIASADRPSVASTVPAHSRRRGPRTGWAR